MSYLQGGTRHRRRRRGWLAVLGVIVAAAAAVVLWPAPGGREHPSRTTPGLGPSVAVAKPPPQGPPAYGRAPAAPPDRISLRFKQPPRVALLWDVRTGRVLFARNAGAPVPIASLTKMMTAVVVTDRASTRDRVLITPEAVHYQGSGVGVLPRGKRIPLVTLLYGLLLPSGNDAAIALAQHVGGSVPGFLALMNSRARALHLPCTHFSTPSGFLNQGNRSCASDLAVIAHTLLSRPLLARIVRTRDAIIPFPIKGRKLFLYNNNPLLRSRYRGTNGVKTGYTAQAGRCLVATARRGRRWLGVVLLNSPDPPTQAMRLLDRGFAR